MDRTIAIATLSSKGQVTIPDKVREALYVRQKGNKVGFELVEGGVLMKPLVIAEQEKDFSENEWDKLEKLANQNGELYTNAKDFLISLREL
ncbi:AbrB/MazE/SpoVT family DNA-binding domain-containing protein [bacterium]|nr:AbrB/MazE/SpoVT family DNA-binding domain-containing protein [bacterium]MBU1753344.1 AbrB/MazE/SpoVT family DNA-binding domain-containing protein [bacterium]